MKKLSGIILVLFFSVSLFAQQSFEMKNVDFSVEYQVDKGKLHGKYVSYYPNGVKKAEGEFYNNQRIGIWTMWNEEGEELLQRDYSNSFVFLHPEATLDDLAYVPYRDDSGCFEYFKLHEKEVLFSKRMMSVILPENNEFLFPAKELLIRLSENQDDKAFQQIKIHDEFSFEPMDLPEVVNSEIIAYKLLQEAVYDSERQIMEIRPVFICPVIYNDVEGTIYEGNYLSYQLLYPYMNEIAVTVAEPEMEVFSMADVFFWQYYQFGMLTFDNSEFSWTDNLKSIDSELFNSDGELNKRFSSNLWEGRIELIEIEHDLWRKYPSID
jgi:hypothetical protein